MKAVHLQTEYLTEPLGIDIVQPRFYWQCEGGITQTAYQLTAYVNEQPYWDTGKVHSARMTHIKYEGKPLKSRNRVCWRVKLWDENGNEGDWAESFFELGLLTASDWTAQWIAGNYKPQKNTRYPVDHFKTTFAADKPVAKARLYATACGCYEAQLNDKQATDFCLAPGMTDYRVRLQYQAYDVTALVQSGSNTLTFCLADGWYRGSIGCFGPTNVFGRQTKLLAQLEITYTDGTTKTVNTGEHFAWSNDGPLRFADLKDGEVYDANLQPSYSGKAIAVTEKLVPCAANNVFPKEQEVFAASLITTPKGKQVLDFGQNIAGFIQFTIKGKKGQKLTLLCGEILDEQGEFTQENIQAQRPVKEYGKLTELLLITGQESKIKGELVPTPLQKIEFICSGGTDTYKTAFSVFGFRYALVETDVPFDAADFKAVAVYSDMERTGTFACSNEMVNRFYENTMWSMKGNFLDVPTDCPTRERLGWTGDAQIFFHTAAYSMNIAPFYRKWLRDVADNQFKNGKISAVIPYVGVDMVYKNTGASVGWGDAAVLVPYRFWKRYGDESILHEFYPMMRRYAMFMVKNTGPKDKKAAKGNPYAKYMYEKGMHLGEWLEPEEFRDTNIGGRALRTEEATAYLHYTMTHMAEIAGALGQAEDAALFAEYADGAINAYKHLFVKDATIDTDRQAKLVRPLALGLIKGAAKQNVQKRLVKAIENRNYTIGTGFLSTPFVLPVLSDAGELETAYKMLENENAPSWLAEVKAGATTVWENWDGEASRNHYSPGAVCEWLYSTVAGLVPAGERHFVIAPKPGGSLTHAKASYASLYGDFSCAWQKSDSGIVYTICVPPNTSAEVLLPSGKTANLYAGTHTFSE